MSKGLRGGKSQGLRTFLQVPSVMCSRGRREGPGLDHRELLVGVSTWWKRVGDNSCPGLQKHLDAAVRAGVRGATCHQGSCQSAAARIELGRVRAKQTPCLPTLCLSGSAPHRSLWTWQLRAAGEGSGCPRGRRHPAFPLLHPGFQASL